MTSDLIYNQSGSRSFSSENFSADSNVSLIFFFVFLFSLDSLIDSLSTIHSISNPCFLLFSKVTVFLMFFFSSQKAKAKAKATAPAVSISPHSNLVPMSNASNAKLKLMAMILMDGAG